MFKRFLFYWLGIFFSAIVPLGLIMYKYGFFTKEITVIDRLGIIGLIAVIVIVAWLFKDLVAFMKSIGNGKGEAIMNRSKPLLVLLMIVFAMLWVTYGVEKLRFVVGWSLISNIIGVYWLVKHDLWLKEHGNNPNASQG